MLHRLSSLASGATSLPAEVHALIECCSTTVNDSDFPCGHSRTPFNTRDLYFGFVADTEDVVDRIIDHLRQLCVIIEDSPEAILALFVEQAEPGAPAADFALASRVVHAVMRANAVLRPEEEMEKVAPSSAEWTLRLDGVSLRIDFSSSAHTSRQSGNVGPTFTLIARAREIVRSARPVRPSHPATTHVLRRPPRPSLAAYGDPGSQESANAAWMKARRRST
ncbi:YqcI/YcgG family protein [Umezawaea tangerina]|uniref:YqcI/YcgG family protein n=1 Tax=Umezawaea tangerina TaxID=84725 RepID=A0A2T0T475_9PSEU|nr:YqcI/YcgG family protein [Umezawaea tangerina]PRY40485.1 YqcI/YcgG family protein [Umezawaea tangerina]